MSLKEEKIAKTVDIKGQICPYTLIETRNALKTVNNGDVIEVLVDHRPAAFETIPNLCKKKAYPVETVEDDGYWRLYIKKDESG
jgi:TusA-related sulfurtransferase